MNKVKQVCTFVGDDSIHISIRIVYGLGLFQVGQLLGTVSYNILGS